MKLSTCLRQVNQQYSALQTLQSSLPGSSLIQTDCKHRYLRVEMVSESDESVSIWVDADELLHAEGTNFPKMPWERISIRYIAQWLEGQHVVFTVLGRSWEIKNARVPTLPLPALLVGLPANPCDLYLSEWPEAISNISSQNKLAINEVPFIARYVIGISYLPLDLLIDIQQGDLIRIMTVNPELKIGNFSLFKLNITAEMDIIVEQKLDITNEMESQDKGVIFEWTSLPVEVEIVLDSFNLTLNELDTIQQGSLLPLTPNAEKKVSIYLNKKFFSQGELVALENGSLAVEVNKINNFSNGVAKDQNVD